MPRSISGVGCFVLPYSESTRTPVRMSLPSAIQAPPWAVPRRPCSGAKSATRFTSGAWCSASIPLRPSVVTEVWLVMNPTRLPRTR